MKPAQNFVQESTFYSEESIEYEEYKTDRVEKCSLKPIHEKNMYRISEKPRFQCQEEGCKLIAMVAEKKEWRDNSPDRCEKCGKKVCEKHWRFANR